MVLKLQLRDIFQADLDKLFCYETPVMALIKDRYLGLIKILINLGILVYFVVYVIVIMAAYIDNEYSTGQAIIYASGTAVTLTNSTVRVWDSVDIAYPQYDPSQIVISTKVRERIREVIGTCTDYNRPCDSTSDCIETGNCTSEGYCYEPTWCSDYNYTDYELDGVENFLIWFQGNVDFIRLAPGYEFSTFDETEPVVYPNSGSNSYLVSDILEKADTKYEDIKDGGAVIKVKLHWECDATWRPSCDPEVTAERVDNITGGEAIGFYYSRYIYYEEEGVKYRDHWNSTGIKFVLFSTGKAYALTLNSIILNLSSAVTLTTITPRIVDFLMLYVMPNRHEYRKLKFKRTKDLDDEVPKPAENLNQPAEEEKKDENQHFAEGPP